MKREEDRSFLPVSWASAQEESGSYFFLPPVFFLGAAVGVEAGFFVPFFAGILR